MWVILEYTLLAFLVLLSITEFFYPLTAGKPLFGTFRKKVKQEQKPIKPSSLETKLAQAKEKIKEIKTVQDEVNQHFKTAEQLKEDADNLLNNSKNN
jgi:ribosomal protein L3